MPPSANQLSRQAAILIGTQITTLREERGWTRYRLAKEARLAPNTVKLLEGGQEPSLGVLLSLVRAFGLSSIEEVLGGFQLGTSQLRAIEYPEDEEQLQLALDLVRETRRRSDLAAG